MMTVEANVRWEGDDDDRTFLDIYGEGVTEEDVVNAGAAAARGDLEVSTTSRFTW